MTVTSEYIVTGMHCAHCVSSVTEEVSAISGVHDVKIDLASGQLVVFSDSAISFEEIEAAVDEAGYTVAVI